MKPTEKPTRPNFSSGPCSKRPGYQLENLKSAPLGRSHRSALGKASLKESIEKIIKFAVKTGNISLLLLPPWN